MLVQATSSGLTSNPDFVTEEELHRLGLEGRLPHYAASGDEILAPEINSRCFPGEDPPELGFTCQGTNEFEYRAPYILNALKGDTILSHVGGLMNNFVRPLEYRYLPEGETSMQQFWNHAGMMTVNQSEYRSSNLNEDQIHDNPRRPRRLNGGWDEAPLLHIWPGVITQSVSSAVFGEILTSPYNSQSYEVRSLEQTSRQMFVRLIQGRRLIPPRVVRPDRAFATPEHRAILHSVADSFRDSVSGHFRLNAFFNVPAYFGGGSGADWYSGGGTTPAAAIHRAMNRPELRLEGAESEPGDVLQTAWVWFEPGSASDTPVNRAYLGLYYYRNDEYTDQSNRLLAYIAEFFRSEISAVRLCPTWPIDWCGGSPEERLAEQAEEQWLYCLFESTCRPRYSAFGDANPEWRTSNYSIRPDDILNWDSPRSGGPYGASERMILVTGDYRRVSRWQPSPDTGTVRVTVTYQGRPMPGARLALLDRADIVTDVNGTATIVAIPAGGPYDVEALLAIGDQDTISDGGFTLSGRSAVSVSSGATTDVNVVLAEPAADSFLVSMSGALRIKDDEFVESRSDYRTFDIATDVLLTPSNRHAEYDLLPVPCVGREVSVNMHVEFDLVQDPTSMVWSVEITPTLDAYEYTRCSNLPADQRFGTVRYDNPIVLWSDGVPGSTGANEFALMDVNLVNGETAGGDYVKSVDPIDNRIRSSIRFAIRPTTAVAAPPVESLRSIVLAFDAQWTDDDPVGEDTTTTSEQLIATLDPSHPNATIVVSKCEFDELVMDAVVTLTLQADWSVAVTYYFAMQEGTSCDRNNFEDGETGSVIVPADGSVEVPRFDLTNPGLVDTVKDRLRIGPIIITNMRL